MKKHHITLTIFILLLSPFLIYSCGGSGGDDSSSNVNNLRVVINFPDGTVQKSNDVYIVARLEELVRCVIIVSGGTPPIDEINEEFDIDEPKRVGVPPRDNLNFMFIGFDMDGNPICRGETTQSVDLNTDSVFIDCVFVTEICTDGIDNNFNELADCQDPDCDRAGCNPDVPVEECMGGVCVDPTPPDPDPTEDPTEQECPESPFPRPFPAPPIYVECFPDTIIEPGGDGECDPQDECDCGLCEYE